MKQTHVDIIKRGKEMFLYEGHEVLFIAYDTHGR